MGGLWGIITMADVRHRTTAGNRFRFLVRFLGLTGVLAAAVGGTLLATAGAAPPEWNGASDPSPVARATAGWHWLAAAGRWLVELATAGPDTATKAAAGLLLGGLAAVALWVLVELIGTLFLVTGRRTAVGTNAYLQIALAAALLVVVNAYSFTHHTRYDLTRDRQFTLPESVVAKLKALDPASPTDVVVLQLHKTAGSLSDKADSLDAAAEKKVVEKVNDLVDLLREIGPRFRVTVLDAQAEGYEDQLDALTKDAPELREAIEAAPENSIFFRGSRSVQRMSFGEFYLLDKEASLREVTTPAGRTVRRPANLVMIPQGVEAFARKVEEVEEKRPKVGLLVIHPELSTRESSDDYSSAGLRRSLEANGFEVVDVLVKQWGGRGGPQPAAFTYDEYDFDRLERTYNYLSTQLNGLETLVREFTDLAKQVRTAPYEKLAQDRRLRAMLRGTINSDAARAQVAEQLDVFVAEARRGIDALSEELKEVGPRYRAAAKNDRAVEGRRTTDLKEKLKRVVDDCDVLVVPRLTAIDLAKGYVIRPSFYTLPQDHADAVRAFLAAGKPVLAAFGPTSFGNPNMEAEADPLERLFGRLGIEFGSQAILTDKEGRAAAERQGDALGSAVDLPAFVFEAPAAGKGENPIAAAYRLTARAVGGKLELRRSGPRPVYLAKSVADRLPFAGEILATVREAWNESRPLADEEYVPKYEPPKPDDAKRGTRDEERRGPFPIGVAIETPVPAEWRNEKLAAYQAAFAAGGVAAGTALADVALDPAVYAPKADRPTVRVVAFGHGGLFTGKKLDPAQEKLLLHTLNWQLRRTDRLPQAADGARWEYPRVALGPSERTLWHLGTFAGLPLLCGYFGLLVLMTRKVR
jgi:hypothetical protein